MSRWVRIDVDMFDHPFFASRDARTEAEAWAWLITHAAWRNTTHRVGSDMVDVPAGSLFVTLRSLQTAWRWKSDKRVRSFLSRLENGRMIQTKTDAGKTQITICNYARYQDAGRTEDAARTQAGRSADALKTPVHQDTREDTSSLRSDVCSEAVKPAPTSPTVIELPATKNETVAITQADVSEWVEAFPAVDVQQKLKAIRQWLINNPQKRKTSRGMKRFVVAWLTRDQDRGGSIPSGAGPPQQQPRKSAFQDRQDQARERLNKALGISEHERSSYDDGNIIDLGRTNYRG